MTGGINRGNYLILVAAVDSRIFFCRECDIFGESVAHLRRSGVAVSLMMYVTAVADGNGEEISPNNKPHLRCVGAFSGLHICY